MPSVPTWILEGTDLDFVRDRRPRNVRELLSKGQPWTDLFLQWYTVVGKASLADRQTWAEVVVSHRKSGSSTKALEQVPKALTDRWQRYMAEPQGDFFLACDNIRLWLEAERIAAKKALTSSRAKTARWPWPLGHYVSDKEVKAQQRQNMVEAITRKRFQEWETQVQAQKSLVAYVEARCQAYTRTVKPLFPPLYKFFAEKGVPDAARQHLEDARYGVIQAEAGLRKACMDMRNPPEGHTLEQAKANLVQAWGAYTIACTAVGTATRRACEEVVSWAAKDTAKKIKDHFASAHPRVATAQLAIKFSVTLLTAVVTALGAGPGAAAAAAAMWAALEAIEQLTVKLVSEAEADDIEVQHRYLGKAFKAPGSDKTAERVGDADRVIGLASGPAPAALKLAAAMGAGDAANQAAAFAAQIGRWAGMLVTLEELVNRQVLEDADNGKALLALLKKAHEILGNPDSSCEVVVSVEEFNAEKGTAEVILDGVRGTLSEGGRFTPNNDDEAFEAVLRSWARGSKDPNPGFKGGGAANPHLNLTLRDGTKIASWENLAAQILTHKHGVRKPKKSELMGFECTAYASVEGADSFSTLSTCLSLWRVKFFISYEGTISFEESDKREWELQWMVMRPASQPEIRVEARSVADIKSLRLLRQKDPALECLTQIQTLIASAEPKFIVKDGRVKASNEEDLDMELEDLIQWPEHLKSWEEMARGARAADPEKEVSAAMRPLFEKWAGSEGKKSFQRYLVVRGIHDYAERWAVIKEFRDSVTDEQELCRFAGFLEADDKLRRSYVEAEEYFGELKERLGRGVPVDSDKIPDAMWPLYEEWVRSEGWEQPLQHYKLVRGIHDDAERWVAIDKIMNSVTDEQERSRFTHLIEGDDALRRSYVEAEEYFGELKERLGRGVPVELVKIKRAMWPLYEEWVRSEGWEQPLQHYELVKRIRDDAERWVAIDKIMNSVTDEQERSRFTHLIEGDDALRRSYVEAEEYFGELKERLGRGVPVDSDKIPDAMWPLYEEWVRSEGWE
ncbi:hypothetical protein AB0N09_41215 [Streptomyces erythrochromogenes]|uniref:hypothetical protein n=1 Tax=Streptomyces erythrochromogenes TaxID=285574 RepID=UPI003419445E